MKYRKLLLALAFIVFTSPAFAEENNYKYELFWSGFKVGEMDLRVKEEGNKYDYLALIESKNILRYFTKYWSANHVRGEIKKDRLIPEEYTSTWNRKKDRQTINVKYGKDGSVKEVVKTPDDRKKHPPVSDELKLGSLDPVTASMSSRRKIKEVVESGIQLPVKFTTPVFDAKRRFDVEHVIKGYETVNVGGRDQNLLHVQFKRNPIAGFKPNKLKEMAKEDPVVDVYLNADFIPVWGFGKTEMGTATIKLAEAEK